MENKKIVPKLDIKKYLTTEVLGSVAGSSVLVVMHTDGEKCDTSKGCGCTRKKFAVRLVKCGIGFKLYRIFNKNELRNYIQIPDNKRKNYLFRPYKRYRSLKFFRSSFYLG